MPLNKNEAWTHSMTVPMAVIAGSPDNVEGGTQEEQDDDEAEEDEKQGQEEEKNNDADTCRKRLRC